MSSIPAIIWPLKQTAVYWAPSTPDAFGKPTWATPVELSVRWDGKVEEFLTGEGERAVSRAIVMVASNVEVNGVLLLSTLSSSVVQDDPKANDGAWEIRMFKTTPDIGAKKELKEAFL